MKRILPFIAFTLLLASTATVFGQQNEEEKKHELKANAFNLIIFKTFDVSYEYIINPNATFGVSILANLQSEPQQLSDIGDMPFYNEQFALTPYYRHFFMNRYAKGFFLEAFGMFNSQKVYETNYFYDGGTETFMGKSDNFALGIAIGGKIVSRRNFVFEFFGGIGRNLYESQPDNGTELVPRVGINLGYRF